MSGWDPHGGTKDDELVPNEELVWGGVVFLCSLRAEPEKEVGQG